MPTSSREKILEGLLPEILENYGQYCTDPVQNYIKVIANKSLLCLQDGRPHALTCIEDAQGREEYMWIRYGVTPTTIRMLEHSFLTSEQVQKIHHDVGVR